MTPLKYVLFTTLRYHAEKQGIVLSENEDRFTATKDGKLVCEWGSLLPIVDWLDGVDDEHRVLLKIYGNLCDISVKLAYKGKNACDLLETARLLRKDIEELYPENSL